MAVKVQQVSSSLNSVSTDEIFFTKFENNGSSDLSVNGLVTPVDFTLPLPVGSDYLLQCISFVVSTDEAIDPGKFGNVAQLANGLDFSLNDKPPIKFLDNGDMLIISNTIAFNVAKITGVAVGIIFGQWDLTESFGGNTPRIYDNSLKITINDDLSALPYFRVSVHGVYFEDA